MHSQPPTAGALRRDRGRYVFATFAVIGSLVTIRYAIETKGRVLEELSP